MNSQESNGTGLQVWLFDKLCISVSLTRHSVTDSSYDEPFSHESVHEIRQRIRMMRNLVDPDATTQKRTSTKEEYESTEDAAHKDRRQSLDTGGFLSFTFGFILFLIIAVGFYAFRNLYQAVVKRFSH